MGNLAGFGAFRFAVEVTPLLWQNGLSLARPENDLWLRLILTAATAMLFASPPVLIGALAARLAGHVRSWIGMAAGLWGFGFVQWWPPLPLLSREAWLGPTILILLSGLVGGWLMETRATVRALVDKGEGLRVRSEPDLP
ncbi:MAG: hypothetical protein HY023_17950 [Chloroflexi bacterium]|nr:hypothetical protein [Chloroflexota bacterium]